MFRVPQPTRTFDVVVGSGVLEYWLVSVPRLVATARPMRLGVYFVEAGKALRERGKAGNL